MVDPLKCVLRIPSPVLAHNGILSFFLSLVTPRFTGDHFYVRLSVGILSSEFSLCHAVSNSWCYFYCLKFLPTPTRAHASECSCFMINPYTTLPQTLFSQEQTIENMYSLVQRSLNGSQKLVFCAFPHWNRIKQIPLVNDIVVLLFFFLICGLIQLHRKPPTEPTFF